MEEPVRGLEKGRGRKGYGVGEKGGERKGYEVGGKRGKVGDRKVRRRRNDGEKKNRCFKGSEKKIVTQKT